jgi:t-SNARE complex subunit (syntaxin)
VEVGSVDVDKAKQYSNLKVRITVYLIVVILLAVFLYLTAWNMCVVFCRRDNRAS